MFRDLKSEVRVILCCFLILMVVINILQLVQNQAQGNRIAALISQSDAQSAAWQSMIQQVSRCRDMGQIDVLLRSLSVDRPDRDDVSKALADFVKEERERQDKKAEESD